MLSNLAYANLISNVNLSQQNAVSNQQGFNQLGVTVTGKSVNLVANLSPLEAVAAVKLDTGNDVAEQLADIKGTVSAFAAPPVTPPAGT
ncbi:MAG TPA: R body protein [Blastocatellia bacterium]|nr:R body protein [Blastocatellia bacterium]